jgi:hypothetical protein
LTLSELGFYWIAHPKTINVNYCLGECSSTEHCCVADKSGQLALNYENPIEESTIKVIRVENALVQRCVCG